MSSENGGKEGTVCDESAVDFKNVFKTDRTFFSLSKTGYLKKPKGRLKTKIQSVFRRP